MIDKVTLVNLLDQGYTNEQISAHFNCGITTVKRAKTKFNLVGYKTNSKPLSIKELTEIEALINKGNGIQQVKRLTGVTAYRLKKYLPNTLYKSMLVQGHENFVRNQIKADITRIFIPSKKSAYICGVLQSDGYLTNDGYIGLTAKDRDFVEDFAKFFNTSAREIIGSSSNTYYSVKFKDVRNLEKFKAITNIYPRKTYSEYTIPLWITSNEDFLYEFIVGLFNGDGWVHRPAGRNTCEIGIEQHIANKGMLDFINLRLGWSTYSHESYYRIHTKTISKVREFYDWYSKSDNVMLRKVTTLDQIFL